MEEIYIKQLIVFEELIKHLAEKNNIDIPHNIYTSGNVNNLLTKINTWNDGLDNKYKIPKPTTLKNYFYTFNQKSERYHKLSYNLKFVNALVKYIDVKNEYKSYYGFCDKIKHEFGYGDIKTGLLIYKTKIVSNLDNKEKKITENIKNKLSSNDSENLENLNKFITILNKKYGDFQPNEYLKKIISSKSLRDTNKFYTELFGEEEYFDVRAFETVDPSELFNNEKYNDEDDNVTTTQESEKKRRIDNILEIINDIPHLHIIGKPGSGKSMTLQKILIKNATAILNGNTALKIPIYIEAKNYSIDNTFRNILERNTNSEWSENSLSDGKLHILIDALDEISDKYKDSAYSEIEFLLKEFPDNYFVISERKKNYENRFKPISVYELKDLDEKGVIQFIKKRTNNTLFEKIWGKLKNDDAMMKLAYNPLTLRMLISVNINTEKKNIKPPNSKGQLFEKFITYLLKRKSTKVLDVHSKFDFLNYVAYVMIEEGKYSMSLSKFKDLIVEKFQKGISEKHKFSKELIDNLVIKMNSEKEEDKFTISFFHTTYRDFFGAIYINEIYKDIDNDLNIDIRESNWSESLLMCSDLMKSESQRKVFFKYLFKGEKGEETLSHEKLLKEQYNETVACKIAFNCRSYDPSIYKLAEKYIYYNLHTWKNIYESSSNREIDIKILEAIFSSIATLGSKKIFFYVFTDSWWVKTWLHSFEEDENHLQFNLKLKNKDDKNLNFNIDTSKIKKELAVFYSITRNNSDFGMLYTLLNKLINYYNSTISIHQRLKRLKLDLISSVSEDKLFQTFKIAWDFDIFFGLLKADIEKILLYEFNLDTIDNNVKVLKELLKHHVRKKLAQKILINEITSDRYEPTLVNNVIDSFFSYNLTNSLIELLEFLIDRKRKLFNYHFSKIQALPFSILPEKFKLLFINPDIFTVGVPYTRSSKRSNYRHSKRTLMISRKYLNDFKNNEIYILNDSIKILVIDNEYQEENEKINQIILSSEGYHSSINFKSKGEILFKTNLGAYVFVYTSYNINNKNNYSFKLNHSLRKERLLDLKKITYEVQIETLDGFRFFHWGNPSYVKNEIHFKIRFRRLTKFKSIPKSGIINIDNDSFFNNEVRLLHPDNVLNHEKIYFMIKKNIKKQKVISFLRSLGITFKFHKLISDINYGIVVRKTANAIRYYSLRESTFFVFYPKKDEFDLYSLEDIIIIEDNGKINLIVDKNDSSLDKVGYIESEISNINNKKSGFIKNKRKSKDYYFNIDSCDFSPKIGDIVRFLPAKNFRSNYKGEPIALRVSLLKK